MTIQRLPAEGRHTVNWANGTSTEIFIHPSDGSFADRNFIYRISTATVEAEESTFTFFEGITRHLMILTGELELIHEGRYTRNLKHYDQDTFSGEWNTRSRGRVTDFNLMLKGEATGSLTHYRLEANTNASYYATTDHYFIYIATGAATLSDGTPVKEGDLIRIGKGTELNIHTQVACDVIVIEVTAAILP